MPPFRWRGVIEGYYGPPWAHEDRLWWIDRLGGFGMNLYVHAPKNDRLQRDEWRTPYPDETLHAFAELVGRGRAGGVEVGFSISPGLSIEYSSRDDVALLVAKLRRFVGLGSRFVSLGLDDVPSELAHAGDRRAFRSLAAAHVALAHAVLEGLGPGVELWLVPTDYLGTGPTPYLEELGEGLDPRVLVGWTGRTVVSPTVRADEAARRAATLRRRLLLWDNYPVSDGPMRPCLHLGPYVGRDPDLAEHLGGVVLNAMQHARASAVAVRTAADFLRDPGRYDPERAFREAVYELGAGSGEAFALFAAAHRFSALAPDDRDRELAAALDEVRRARSGEAKAERERLGALLAARLEAADAVREGLADRRLAAELEPWLASHRRECERMRAALDFLATLAADGPALPKVLALFGLEARARGRNEEAASFGPRRVLYPQLASLQNNAARFAKDPSLYLDRCLADELVRLAEQRAAEELGLVIADPPGGRAP
jgi:hyaluronoglucosaminidase